MPLLYISVAWLLGTWFGSFFSLPHWLLSLGLAGFIPAIFLPRYRKSIILISISFIALIGGALRYQSSIQPLDSSQLRYYNDKGIVEMVGMISDAPVIKGKAVSFRFASGTFIHNGMTADIQGDALVRLPFYKELKYGDMLRLTGKPETPQQIEDFDYKNYLSNQGIYTVMYYPHVEILARDKGFAPISWIYTLRGNLGDSLARSLPEPQASLSQAILLGLRTNIPTDIMQAFYASGTTHLLAISGLNLTIILGMTLAATIWLFGRRYKIYIWLSLALIWTYALLTGFPPTVARAAIMGSVFLLAELSGRQRSTLAALSLAAAIMVAIEPRVMWDVSFQLSFLSMLGLIYISPYLINRIEEAGPAEHSLITRGKQLLVIGFGTALAAVLATWPAIATYFKTFSIAGIPATFFAMPAMPAIIMTSILTAFAGWAWHPAGVFFGWIAWLFLSFFLLVIRVFSAIPYMYIQGLELQPWQIALYYAALALVLLALKYRKSLTEKAKSLVFNLTKNIGTSNYRLDKIKYGWLLAALLLANIPVWIAVSCLPDGKLHVYVLDVGQGESILIRTPSGQNILVDTGPDPQVARVQLGKYLPFWERQIDLLILTQPQADHNSGAIDLIRNYRIKNITMPPLPSYSEFTRKLNDEMSQKGLVSQPVVAGKVINLEQGIRIEVLNPPAELLAGTVDDINNNTSVLKLEWDGVSFLFTSDIEEEAERYLLEKRANLRSDVLKVAHHGSRGSTCDSFLATVHPSAAVISAGEDNRFGHPHREIVNKLAVNIDSNHVYNTMVNGTVEFITDGARLWCKTERVWHNYPVN